MTGVRTGVAAWLKQINSRLINVHCVSQTGPCLCWCAWWDKLQIHKSKECFCSSGSVLLNRLSGLLFWSWCKMKLSEKARSVVAKNAWKACRTCWLSTSNAVDGVCDDFVPIIQAINFADEKDGLTTYVLSKMKVFSSLVHYIFWRLSFQSLLH